MEIKTKNKVKEKRIEKNITQENLARMVDVTLTTIQNIENKHYEPKVHLAIKLKKALQCETIEELFPL